MSMQETNQELAPRNGAFDWILWSALFIAFSPVWVDQMRHWLEADWARYSSIFVPLLVWAIHRSPVGVPRRKLGMVLLTLSLVLQLVVARSAMLELARPVFSLSVIGLVLITGAAPLRTALLALWIVPVPHFIVSWLGGSSLATDLFTALAAPLSRLGLALEVTGRVLVSGTQEMHINAVYTGLPLFVLLSGLGWYRALRLELKPLLTLRCLLLHVLFGVPIQLAAIALALVAFALGAQTATGILLQPVPWLLCTLAVTYFDAREGRGRENCSGQGVFRRFVLLDRDGTLVRDHGYTHRIEDYELLPGVVEGLQRLQAAGYAFAIITNQSGIGRGYYTEQAFRDFQSHLLADLARSGISIEKVYFCPHRPDEGCACRKPEPAMLHQMSRELGADLEQCWMVGDGLADLQLAERAGCRGAILVMTGLGRKTSEQVGPEIPRAVDLRQAADIILAAGMEGGPHLPFTS